MANVYARAVMVEEFDPRPKDLVRCFFMNKK